MPKGIPNGLVGKRLVMHIHQQIADLQTTLRTLEAMNGHHKEAAIEDIADAAFAAHQIHKAKRAKASKRMGRPLKALVAARTTRKDRGSKIRQQRARSAKFLAFFDAVEPRTANDAARRTGMSALLSGSLVRRGYLAKLGNGYVRTEKAFEI